MNDTHKNRTIVLAITEGGLTHTEAARRFDVSTRWIRTLMNCYRTGGLDAGPESVWDRLEADTRPSTATIAHAGKRVLLLMAGADTMVIDRTGGQIIAEHTINPARGYQAKRKPER